MLDKRTTRLMDIILRLCGEGSYKIVEIKDLIKAMLPRYKIDADAVAQIIKFLSNNEMIDIKYSDENVYCIAVLPKGRVYDESRASALHNVRYARRMALITMIGSFISAFLGAVLAGIIMK